MNKIAPENYTPTARALMTGTSQGECDKMKKTRVYCSGSHKPDQCDKLKTRQENHLLKANKQMFELPWNQS